MSNDFNQYSLKQTMELLMGTYAKNPKLAEIIILDKYERIVGKTIAKYTDDLKFRTGTLNIFIETAPLKQELEYRKEDLKKELNKALGEELIKEIEIRKY